MTTSTLIGTLLTALLMGVMLIIDIIDEDNSFLFDDDDFDK